MPHNILTNKDYYTSIYLVNDELQYMLADAPAGATVGQMPGQVLGGATPYLEKMGPLGAPPALEVSGPSPHQQVIGGAKALPAKTAPIGTPTSANPIIHSINPPIGHVGTKIQIHGENFFSNGMGGTTANIQVEFWYGWHPGFVQKKATGGTGPECPVRWWPVSWGPYTKVSPKTAVPYIGAPGTDATLYGGQLEGVWSWQAAPKLISSILIEIEAPELECYLYKSPVPEGFMKDDEWYQCGYPEDAPEFEAPNYGYAAGGKLADIRVASVNVYYLDTTGHRHDVTPIIGTPGLTAGWVEYNASYYPGVEGHAAQDKSAPPSTLTKAQNIASKGMQQKLPEFRYLTKAGYATKKVS